MYGTSGKLLTFDPEEDELLTFDLCELFPPNKKPFLNPPKVWELALLGVLPTDSAAVGFSVSPVPVGFCAGF